MKLLPINIINIIIQSNNNIIIKWLHSDIIKEKLHLINQDDIFLIIPYINLYKYINCTVSFVI